MCPEIMSTMLRDTDVSFFFTIILLVQFSKVIAIILCRYLVLETRGIKNNISHYKKYQIMFWREFKLKNKLNMADTSADIKPSCLFYLLELLIILQLQ